MRSRGHKSEQARGIPIAEWVCPVINITVLGGGCLAFLFTALTPLIRALLHSCVSLENRTTIPSTPVYALAVEGESGAW